jgi:transposase
MRRQLWLDIRALRGEGLSVRAIARRLGVHRRTVRVALASEAVPPRPGRRGGSVIDPHRGWLLAKLEQYPELSAARLFRMLADGGFDGSYSLVKETVAGLRPRLKPVHLTLSYAPGECAQADWGSWGAVEFPGGRRRLSFFVMVLCHSRKLFAKFFLGEAIEHWLQAHRDAFEFFGGVPARVVVDNCKTAVLRPRGGGLEPEMNPAYLDFAAHYGFTPFPCNPHRPNEKGRVENAVAYIRSSFLAGRGPQAPEVLAPALMDWLENTANVRVHHATGRRPAEMFDAAERAALRPLPAGPHPCASVTVAVASSRCRVTVDANRYSVPWSCASRRLVVRRHAWRVVAWDDGGAVVADHPRCHGRNQDVVDPDHESGLRIRVRHAREALMLDAFLKLGPAAAPYLEALRRRQPSWRAHVERVNALAEIHGRAEVARAMADALEFGAFSSDYILNLLDARSRLRPEPVPLRLERNADLLDLVVPEPNLEIYERRSKDE